MTHKKKIQELTSNHNVRTEPSSSQPNHHHCLIETIKISA